MSEELHNLKILDEPRIAAKEYCNHINLTILIFDKIKVHFTFEAKIIKIILK